LNLAILLSLSVGAIWIRPFTAFVLDQFAPVSIYVAALVLVPPLRSLAGWSRPGRFGPRILVALFALAAVVAFALVLWVHYSHVNLSPYRRALAGLPGTGGVGAALFFGFAFSLFNALREEILWRGVAMDALDAAIGPGVWSIVIQGLHFGFAHYRGGFPNGLSGALLASLFGIVLGAMRRRTRGLLACTLAHVAADAAITVIVIFSIGAA
jgi:membrane protease YdiL (CAAX protease family)